jgi:pimeloyl-ACP methyl ester carboxylesterase
MKKLPVAWKLICGDPAIENPQLPALIGQAIAQETAVEYEAIPETSHFLQVERPEECVRAMEAFLRARRFID